MIQVLCNYTLPIAHIVVQMLMNSTKVQNPLRYGGALSA